MPDCAPQALTLPAPPTAGILESFANLCGFEVCVTVSNGVVSCDMRHTPPSPKSKQRED